MTKRSAFTDKQRLDWLAKNPWSLEDCIDMDGDDFVFCFDTDSNPADCFKGLRSAIDAAIRAMRVKGKGKR